MIGLINLNKPRGITSSDAVVKVKKILSTKAVGHMGTLDPQGEGVLILGVGKATRLFDYYLRKDKVYVADFTFGYATDTLDGDGKVTLQGGIIPSKEQIKAALPSLTGKLMQLPPAYSAKKIGGKKAYDMARKGEAPLLTPSEVTVYSFELISMNEATATVEINCSSGTYIRSLCRDLADKLGTYATMTAIKRTRCGNFDIRDAISLDEVSENKLISVENALKNLRRIELPDGAYKAISNGVKVPCDGSCEALVFCRNELFGIGEVKGGFVSIKVYLHE